MECMGVSPMHSHVATKGAVWPDYWRRHGVGELGGAGGWQRLKWVSKGGRDRERERARSRERERERERKR